MSKVISSNENRFISYLFILIPTVMLIIGYFIFPYPADTLAESLIQIPIFLGLFLLGVGFLLNQRIRWGGIIKILGWMIFTFYWATQPATLYYSESGDIFNASVCVIGVFVLSYIAYHEWLSLERKENTPCINWISGASSIAGLIYFGIERSSISFWMIETVALHSGWMLNVVIGNVEVSSVNIFHNGSYVVTIIFACTAIQAMVIFIGMIGALQKIEMRRRILGLVITLTPIYILNISRNALIGYLLVNNITDFNVAHNVIAKFGALVTLIILLFIVMKFIPEIFNQLNCLIDLYKRNGPIEQTIKRFFSRNKGI